MAATSRTTYRSKAVRLADRLEQEIVDGRWPSGAFLPAEEALARHLAVARMTLRRALALLAGRGRLQRIPHRGVLVLDPSQPAQPAPRRRRARRAIAALLAARPDVGLARIRAGIERWAREHGYSFHLLSHDSDHERPFAVLSHAVDLGVDGLIVLPYPGDAQQAVLEELARRRFPTVCVERRSPAIPLPSVEPDNRAGMRQAVLHLIERHRRPVHYFTLRCDHHTDRQRQEGWAEAMAGAGYGERIADHLHIHARSTADPAYWNGDQPWQHGYDLATALFAGGARRCSIACQKDYVAWGVYRAAAEAGLRVGREIALTGFDDLAFASTLDPPLTTVRQDLEAKGHQAAGLLERVMTLQVDAPIQLLAPVELVVRASS